MEKETKKIIILASVGIMTLAGIIGVSAVPIEDGLSYVDGDRKKEDDLGANYFPLIKSTVFDDSFSDKTFYVQQNGDVRVLSLNKQINGYENIGVYSSKSSADKVFYVATSDKDGVYHFEAVSYDELENVYGYDNMIFVIDEYAPNFILEESFIPDESIVQGYSKKKNIKN